jgi:hypothetical protein
MVAEDILYRFDPRKIKVLSGDIAEGYWELRGCVMHRVADLFKEASTDADSRLDLDQQIASIAIETVDESNQACNLAGIGIGALAGFRFFGPLGALGGAVIGQTLMGNCAELKVEVQLKDGKSFVAQMDKNIHKRLKAIEAASAQPS